MALFANANRGKNAQPFKPEDFLKLSFELTPEVEERPLTFKEVKEHLGSRIKKNGV